MENMDKIFTPPKPPLHLGESRVIDAFAIPFWPLTLRRPMPLFKDTLGLIPGTAQFPDLDFFIRLVSRHPTHQAMLREALGESKLKNLENLLRGRHNVSQKTMAQLADEMQLSIQSLQGLAHGQKDGLLLPGVPTLVQMVEGFFSWIYELLISTPVPCPCCNANLLDDVDIWWRNQPIGLAAPEYHFVERLLAALSGWYFLSCRMADSSKGPTDVVRLVELSHPAKSPIGHWLSFVKEAYSCKNLVELEKQLAAHGRNLPEGGDVITQPRLKKWSSSRKDLMPLEAGECMIAGLPDETRLKQKLIIARVLTLVQDFLYGTAVGDEAPDWAQIRITVSDRLKSQLQKAILRFYKPKPLEDAKFKEGAMVTVKGSQDSNSA